MIRHDIAPTVVPAAVNPHTSGRSVPRSPAISDSPPWDHLVVLAGRMSVESEWLMGKTAASLIPRLPDQGHLQVQAVMRTRQRPGMAGRACIQAPSMP